jgi:hypothetical protein
MKIGFSGINHFNRSQSVQSFKFSRIRKLSFHKLYLSRAKLSSSASKAHLSIEHGKTSLKGTWKFLSQPLKRWRKPLLQSPDGWIDWKVWTPLAEVKLIFRDGKKISVIEGTGYIDFVRSTIPFWKLPIKTLHWGRMHSPNSWSVFLSLKTKEENISLYLDPQTTAQDVSVSLKHNEFREAKRLTWTISSLHGRFNFDGSVARILETQEILNKGRSLRILPKKIQKLLSSSGRDEKYEIFSQFRNQQYHGIMEEVRFHE